LQAINKDYKDNYKHKDEIASSNRSIDISNDNRYEALNKVIKNQGDEAVIYKSKIAELEKSIKVYKENAEMNESKKNISDTLKSKIEKAIDREASLLKKSRGIAN